MKLTVQIIAFEHGSKFTDGRPRMTLRIQEADSSWNEIRFPVTSLDGLSKLGDMHDLELKGITVAVDVAR